MPPKPWPIVIDSLYGDVPNGLFPAQDTSQQLVLLPFGGLREVVHFPNCTEIREGWSWDDYTYWLARRGSDTVLFKVDDSYNYVELGFFSTSYTGPAWMRNNPTQLCMVDGVWGYVYTPTLNLFEAISDPDFEGASCLEYQDGYGLFGKPNSNQWFFSAQNDFKSFDALDFYSKQSTTDNLRTIRSFNSQPFIFGTEKGSELWYNAGGDNATLQTPTFARYPGGVINYGAASAKSESSLEGTGIIFLSSLGQLMRLQGTTSQVVNNGMFDREVAGDGTPEHPGYSKIDDAVGFSFKDQNHIFHQITFPSAGVTWVYDATTNLMVKRQSWKTGGGYGRHRANCYVLHKGKHFVGDYENGKVYEMSTNYFDDSGQEIQRTLYTLDRDFGDERTFFPDITILLETGQGLPGNQNAQAGLEFTSDGGKTWSYMVNRSAGYVGEYGWQINYRQMGSGFRRQYRLTMTDPILWRINGLKGFG